MRIRGWRKVGAAVVRWPGPSWPRPSRSSLVGLLTLPGYQTNYNDRNYLPADLPANEGYAAAERHFSPARMNPELLLIESDHDLRNSADFLVINRIAKAISQVNGISRVQAITRPQGTTMEHSTIPFMLSMGGTNQTMNRKYMQDRMADMLVQVAGMQTNIDTMDKMIALMEQMNATMKSMVAKTHNMVVDVAELRDHIADFDDFFRPMRNYLYWEPHCINIPVCWAMRSTFDSLDGIDTMTDAIQSLLPDMDRLNELLPQMLALMPANIATMKTMKTMMQTQYQTQKGMQDQMAAMQDGQTEMGKAFDTAKNDDTFYLPPEIFDNAEFKRGMKSFLSPDGHAVRFIISHEGDPMTADGISRIDEIKQAAKEAMKGTPLEGSRIYLGGTAATFKDMQEGNNYDLMIAGISALALIFIIMLLITRSLVAAAVIVGTVVLSLGASFGLSVLIWQHIIGIELHFMVMAMAVIILLAVGADYNLLLVARFKEEIHAGLNTGIIRAMGGTRIGRDRRRPGVRLHDGVDGRQPAHRDRPGRHHDRVGSAVRHPGDPVVHDAVHRGADGPLVLVAATGPEQAGADTGPAAAGPAGRPPDLTERPRSPQPPKFRFGAAVACAHLTKTTFAKKENGITMGRGPTRGASLTDSVADQNSTGSTTPTPTRQLMNESVDVVDMPDQLTAFDALMHRGEANPRTRSGIMAIQILESAPEWNRFRDLFDNASRCPERGEARVALSSFRKVEQLPGRCTRPCSASRSTAAAGRSTRGSSRTMSSTGRRWGSAKGSSTI